MAVVVKSPCIIDSIIKHTEDMATIVLLPQRRISRFLPGQFLHFSMDEYDPSKAWPESRVFSIANYDCSRKKIRITYIVKGKYTNRMYKELSIGDRVWIKLPYGNFTFHPNSDTMVLIAGGTGITPIIALFESLHSNEQIKIVLYFGVKSKDRMIYLKELDYWERKYPFLQIHKFIESGGNANGINNGSLNIVDIFKNESTLGDVDYYITGPPQMIESFKNYLLTHGVSNEFIHVDDWE